MIDLFGDPELLLPENESEAAWLSLTQNQDIISTLKCLLWRVRHHQIQQDSSVTQGHVLDWLYQHHDLVPTVTVSERLVDPDFRQCVLNLTAEQEHLIMLDRDSREHPFVQKCLSGVEHA